MHGIEGCGKDITCVMCQYNASVIKINELTIRWGKSQTCWKTNSLQDYIF